MRPISVLSLLVAAASAAPFSSSTRRDTQAKFSIAHPGDVDDVVVTKDNTLNGTYNDEEAHVRLARAAVTGSLPLSFVNNFSGGSVNAYISGLDSDDKVVFVAADGSLVYPSSGGSKVPVPITQNIAIPLTSQGSTLNMVLPITLSSGRIYFAEGELQFFMVDTGVGDGLVQPSVTNLADPSAGTNWGFVELTYTTDKALWANISFVDFVGMILGMTLSSTDGGIQSTEGLGSNAVSDICNGLVAQAGADGYPWSAMCVANSAGNLIRVLAPGNYATLDPNAFAQYWTQYVDAVWDKYSTTPLTINTQGGAGNVQCSVSGDTLTCAGDNRGYAKPSAVDIWGCNSGPFAIQEGDNAVHVAVVPRLCAAFVRSTLLLDGGSVQPSLDSSYYYTVDPTNHYSRIIHEHEADGRGYAFPYDDVNPDGTENASGVVSSGDPGTLTIYVGGPPA